MLNIGVMGVFQRNEDEDKELVDKKIKELIKDIPTKDVMIHIENGRGGVGTFIDSICEKNLYAMKIHSDMNFIHEKSKNFIVRKRNLINNIDELIFLGVKDTKLTNGIFDKLLKELSLINTSIKIHKL